MAADKEIMKALETLRLDRPGRMYAAADPSNVGPNTSDRLTAALRELAATFREEAELWAKSGARGWKSAESDAYHVATAIEEVVAQLDNAGGGGAAFGSHPDRDAVIAADNARLEAELRESAARIDSVTDLAGLDRLIADSVAQRKGHVRDEFLPEGSAARSDATTDNVTAYLAGEADDIPGTPPLTPGSVTSAPEADNPFAEQARARLDSLHDFSATITVNGPAVDGVVPVTWESETMTADGHRTLGAAPLLGQPGDASAGYSHAYVPPGGRQLTYAELLTQVPAASLPPHLSHSQIGDAGDCGVKYRLQRVEHLPQVPQWANVGGAAFHAAAEAIERMMVKEPSLSLDGYDVELAWKHHFEGQVSAVAATSPVPVSMWRASRKGAEGRAWWDVNGPLMLRRYLDARPDEPTMVGSSGVAAIEIEMTVEIPTPYGPLPFKAVLDRVTIRPDGTLMIRDYKTSYERPTDTTQLGEYAWVLAMFNAFGPDRANTGSIFGTYFDARRGTWTEPVDLLAAHSFEAFQYRVTVAHAQKRALTTGPTPARPSSFCGGCSVRYACPVLAGRP